MLGELGVEVEVKKKATLTLKKSESSLALRDQRFVEEQVKSPNTGMKTISLTNVCVRLERLSALEECRELLKARPARYSELWKGRTTWGRYG